MENESTWDSDLGQEKIVGRFLDDFYPIHFSGTMERVSDSKRQNEGIDLIFSSTKNGVKHLSHIDEKAQTSYLNSSLPTFVFEISYIKNSSKKNGWFFNEHKLTNNYFLITHIFTIDSTIKKLENHNQIKSCLLTKVHRNTLIELLKKEIITNPDGQSLLKYNEGNNIVKEVCENISENFKIYIDEEVIKNNESLKYKNYQIKLNNLVKISYSPGLPEKPLNLLIKLKSLYKPMNSIKKGSIYDKYFNINQLKSNKNES